MFNFRWEAPLNKNVCFVDPVTLTGLALAGVGGALGTKALAGSASAPTPAAPTPPPAAPAPAQQPGARAAATSEQPTFLGSAAVPQQSGSKTLLGQ